MTLDLTAAVARVQIEQETARLACQHRLAQDALLDEDGYPTTSVTWMVEHWPFDDPAGWFDLVKQVWHFAGLTWRDFEVHDPFEPNQPVTHVAVSTFGWSGNEALIRAMQANVMLWSMHWVQSQRGGHYVFERPRATPVDGSTEA